MLERLTRNKRNLALAGLGLLVLLFAWSVRSVLNPLILGYLLAYIVHPLVEKLEHRGWRRVRAVNLIFVIGFLILTLGLAVVLQQSHALVRDLAQRDGDLVSLAETRVEAFVRGHESWFDWLLPDKEPAAENSGDKGSQVPQEGLPAPTSESQSQVPAQGASQIEGESASGPPAKPVDSEEVFGLGTLARALWERLREGEGAQAQDYAIRGATGAWAIAQQFFGSVMALIGLIVLLPIYTYFLLFELERIHGFVRRYLPKRERERFSRIGRQIGEVLANFFRGRLLVCLLKGLVLALGLFLCGVEYALLLGMLSGLLSLVPFVGPMIGFIFASLVALLSPEFSVLGALLRTGLVFGAGELIEGYLLVPKILGDSLGLHPVVVLVSIFIGGAALGMFGFLIALPLTASVLILVRELVLPALRDFAEEDAPPKAQS